LPLDTLFLPGLLARCAGAAFLDRREMINMKFRIKIRSSGLKNGKVVANQGDA